MVCIRVFVRHNVYEDILFNEIITTMKQSLSCFIGVVLCFSLVFSAVGMASAQTSAVQATEATINSLLQLLQSLQIQLADLLAAQSGDSNMDVLNPPSLAGRQMQTRTSVRVRTAPAITGAVMATLPAGTIGTVLAGPVERDGNSWWKVQYTTGVTGWSAGMWLNFLPEPETPPAPMATCSLATDKTTYVVNEPVTVTWSSNGAAKAWFADTTAARSLRVSTADVAAEGDQKTALTKVGTYTLTLKVVGTTGYETACTRTFTVTPPIVTLQVNGIDTTAFSANLFDSLQVVNYMRGDITSCTLRGEYELGTFSIPAQIWNRFVDSRADSLYGQSYFSAVGSYQGKGLGSLNRIIVSCGTKGYGTVEDRVDFTVRGDESAYDLSVTLNGSAVYKQTAVNQVNAYAACVGEIDRHQYSIDLIGTDVMTCTWNGKVLKTVSGWKG